MDTQKDLLVQLFESTQALHERFGDEWTRDHAVDKAIEEWHEVGQELDKLQSTVIYQGVIPDLVHELIDLNVTVMSILIRMEINAADLFGEKIKEVIRKNNAKTHETHERKNGMIVKRGKHG